MQLIEHNWRMGSKKKKNNYVRHGKVEKKIVVSVSN
jgi:hypothetical protein